MGKIYFTADTHFGHANIIKYCNRPFASAAIMDAEMIERWNKVVGPKDTVYHLGDFTLGNFETFASYAAQLNGSFIYIIPGGHDERWAKFNFDLAPQNIYGRFKIMPPLLTRKYYGNYLTLCHYPMKSWERSHYGHHHLHGHCHGTIGTIGNSSDVQLPPGEIVGKRMDVGVDCHDFYPISLEQVITTLSVASNDESSKDTDAEKRE